MVQIYEVSGSLSLFGTHETSNLKGCFRALVSSLMVSVTEEKHDNTLFPSAKNVLLKYLPCHFPEGHNA